MPAPELAPPPWAQGYVHGLGEGPAFDFRERQAPEDFEVEERLPCEPCGRGGHLWLWIEKRGLSTPEASALLESALELRPGSVRHAGLKDKHALTRQWLSVPGLEPAAVEGFEAPGLRVLAALRHVEPLRLAAHVGNRFRLRLADLAPDERAAFEERLRRLEREGLANYFGAQRFGAAGRAHLLGRLLVERRVREYALELVGEQSFAPSPALLEFAERLERGSASALRGLHALAPRLPRELRAFARELARWRAVEPRALGALPVDLVRMHLSALQARVFNRVLARRLEGAGIDTPLGGEVCLEGRPSGPLPGWRLERAAGEAGALEQAVWSEEGAPPEAFRGLGRGLDRLGARRALRVPLRGVASSYEGTDVRLEFDLPAGSYATTVLEELSRRLDPGRRGDR